MNLTIVFQSANLQKVDIVAKSGLSILKLSELAFLIKINTNIKEICFRKKSAPHEHIDQYGANIA